MASMLIAALFCVVAAVGSSQAPDCISEPDNMLCCVLEPETGGCLLQFSELPYKPCSPACMKRYQSLGYECYKKYKVHAWWENMERQCDPQGRVEFKPPTTSYVPSYGAAKAISAACPCTSSRFVLVLLPGLLFAALS
eukprot:TRINITY_DN104318_c0_g1_i1.p1 TRINITY_DN104318_c0_g1~~TRINITY_DN104318_c0_g1_i1.p1  ORF type:complete len:138 (-),score=13.99 TRINITY_DN104318_c0_g1_i1:362-775(-)